MALGNETIKSFWKSHKQDGGWAISTEILQSAGTYRIKATILYQANVVVSAHAEANQAGNTLHDTEILAINHAISYLPDSK